MLWKRAGVWAAAWLAACWLVSAAVVICEKCGHEAAGDITACAHCGAALPKSDPSVPAGGVASNVPVADGMIATQALAAVREDVRLARENEGRPELAIAFYGNALAMLRLVPQEAVPADAGSRLVDGMAACRGNLARTARSCSACGGSGNRGLKLQSLTGDTDKSIAGTVVCETCDGAGVVQGGRTADELRVALAQGRREFEVREQAAGRVAVGRAWVPQALAARLDLSSQVLLRTSASAPCSACQGVGLQTCSGCRGLGRVRCRQSGCDNGWVIRKSSNSLAPKAAVRQRMPCPACQGTGWIACATCRGGGAVACKACQGSGQPPRCTRCGGEGTAACTRCRGTGKVGIAVCPACGGEKLALCAACHGEGRLSR